MLHMTRDQIAHQAAQLDQERRGVQAQLDALDILVPRYEAAYEQAKRADAAYEEQLARVTGEISALLHEHHITLADQHGVAVVLANDRPVPSGVERRLGELCAARSRLELDRADALKNGYLPAATAWHRWDRARIDRDILRNHLASLGG